MLTDPEAAVLTIGSESQTFFLGHALPVGSIDIAIDIGTPGAPDGKGLSYHHTPHGYRIHLPDGGRRVSPFVPSPQHTYVRLSTAELVCEKLIVSDVETGKRSRKRLRWGENERHGSNVLGVVVSDLPPFLGVPARNDDSCHQVLSVSVTHLLKEAGCRVY